jgi:hypothetical protein
MDAVDKETIVEPDIKQEHALSRRLTRILLDGISGKDFCCLTHPSPSGSSYMVHLSIWITHEAVDTLFERSANPSDGVSTPLEALLQSCILRPGFSIAGSRKSQPPHAVTTTVASFDKPENSNWKEEDGVWVSLPTSLKGFRI